VRGAALVRRPRDGTQELAGRGRKRSQTKKLNHAKWKARECGREKESTGTIWPVCGWKRVPRPVPSQRNRARILPFCSNSHSHVSQVCSAGVLTPRRAEGALGLSVSLREPYGWPRPEAAAWTRTLTL